MNKKKSYAKLENEIVAAPKDEIQEQLKYKKFYLVQLVISLIGFILSIIALIRSY